LTALVTAESVVLLLLVVLVAGLLRSHADILRALHGLGVRLDPRSDAHLPSASVSVGAPQVRSEAASMRGSGSLGAAAVDLVGLTPTGEAILIGLGASTGGDVLLAFLSSGCGTCAAFWQSFRQGAHSRLGARVVAVTRDPAEESPSTLDMLSPADVTVVMSSAAWGDYSVPGSPFFLYLAGGRVVGEGTASTWGQLATMCTEARSDGARAGAYGDRQAPWASDAEREARADAELLAAGIEPGHPSLYPKGR
jgi:hypothetical protein